jgi:hypothetical protein
MDRRRFLAGVGATAGAATLSPLLAGVVAKASAANPFGSVAEHSADTALAWFELSRQLVRSTPGFTPPVAARAFGYAGVTLYESVHPGLDGRRSLAGRLNGLATTPHVGRDTAYLWPEVANAALAHVVRLLFPVAPTAQLAAIDALEGAFRSAYEAGTPPGVIARSRQRGRDVADAIFEWSRTDGGHAGYLRNFPADYTPPTGPGLWVPTAPGFQRALQPSWGANRSFVAGTDSTGHPGAPTEFSTDPASQCFADALEVYDTVNRLEPEQVEIARFWSDDPGLTATPPGHSMAIAGQVLRDRGAGLDVAAETFAKVGVAVADAFIACWRVKYEYNVLRPITYVTDVIDPAWGNTLPLGTPPFPEYTSGHSVQSAAAATVLADLFGTVAFTDRTHDERGLPARTFTSFHDAAAEAAISRLYGGIHFQPAIERGLDQGRAIGELVNRAFA